MQGRLTTKKLELRPRELKNPKNPTEPKEIERQGSNQSNALPPIRGPDLVESWSDELWNCAGEWAQDAALQTEWSLLPSESNHQLKDNGEMREVNYPSLSPFPSFAGIDYNFAQFPRSPDLLLSWISCEGQGSLTSNSALLSQPDTVGLNTAGENDILMSTLNSRNPAEGSAPLASEYLIQEADLERACQTSTSSIVARKATLDDPTTWDAIMGPVARNITLEDIVAAGTQVLLFNRSSPSSFQTLATSAAASSNLPSPYLNAFQLNRSRTLAACLHNARSIGMLAFDALQQCCITPSPFYRPHTPSDNPLSLLAAASKPGIPEYLQPMLPQVLFQHPSFLDLIPMPGFRARVILAAMRGRWGIEGSEFFDLSELKKDIFQDGITCSVRQEGKQPWDRESWEAAEWFVSKWKGLFSET